MFIIMNFVLFYGQYADKFSLLLKKYKANVT